MLRGEVGACQFTKLTKWPQQRFVLRYKQIWLVKFLCCYCHTTLLDLFSLGPLFVTYLQFMFK